MKLSRGGRVRVVLRYGPFVLVYSVVRRQWAVANEVGQQATWHPTREEAEAALAARMVRHNRRLSRALGREVGVPVEEEEPKGAVEP